MSYRLGADIGGTFTDVVLVDEAGGVFRVGKVLTTSDAPDQGVVRHPEVRQPVLRRHAALVTEPDRRAAPIRAGARGHLVGQLGRRAAGQHELRTAVTRLGQHLGDDRRRVLLHSNVHSLDHHRLG